MKILGEHHEVYPVMMSPAFPHGIAFLQYVLTEGTVNDKCVYVGVVPDYSMDGDAYKQHCIAFVTERGNKVPYEKAVAIWYKLERKEYRG